MATRLPASTNIDKQALISGLQKYGGIKSIIQELTQQLDELRNQIDELQRQKKDLDEQNKNMLSILAYSRPVVEFLHRSDDDYSLSSDYNNVKILAMIAIILYMLYIRDEGIGKLLVGDVKELVPLLRVAVRGRAEETVSVPELKLAVAKALTILIAKLDTKSQTSKENIIVQDTTSLTNDQQNKQ